VPSLPRTQWRGSPFKCATPTRAAAEGLQQPRRASSTNRHRQAAAVVAVVAVAVEACPRQLLLNQAEGGGRWGGLPLRCRLKSQRSPSLASKDLRHRRCPPTHLRMHGRCHLRRCPPTLRLLAAAPLEEQAEAEACHKDWRLLEDSLDRTATRRHSPPLRSRCSSSSSSSLCSRRRGFNAGLRCPLRGDLHRHMQRCRPRGWASLDTGEIRNRWFKNLHEIQMNVKVRGSRREKEKIGGGGIKLWIIISKDDSGVRSLQNRSKIEVGDLNKSSVWLLLKYTNDVGIRGSRREKVSKRRGGPFALEHEQVWQKLKWGT